MLEYDKRRGENMILDKNRYFIILNNLINHRDRYMTSQDLSYATMSSVRSIKDDLKYIDDQLQKDDYGYIEARKANGYRLVISDEDSLKELKDIIRVHQLLFHNVTIEAMNRRLYIVQTLLSQDSVMVDDLADALYVSRSTLTKDKAWAVSFLSSYDLAVKSQPGKGLFVSGDEHNQRMAMVEVFSSQYHEIEPLYPVTSFLSMFDEEIYEDLRHEMLKIIRESEMTISDIAAKKIATYLCLVVKRHKTHPVQLSEDMQEDLAHTYEYQLAQDIFAIPLIHTKGIDDHQEILNLTRLLLINKDIDLRMPQHLSTTFFDEADLLYERLIDTFVYQRHLSFFGSDVMKAYAQDFKSLLLRLLLIHHYDHTNRKRLVTYTDMGETVFSPLALDYARITIEEISSIFQEKIYGNEVNAFAAFYHILLKKLPLSYRPLRLAVFAMEGLTIGEMMKEELLAMFDPLIEHIDVFNLYEMRRISFADYDAAISSWDVAYYRYPIPLISYQGINPLEDANKLLKELFIHSYDRRLLESLKQRIECYDDALVDDYDMMIDIIIQKYVKSSKQEIIKEKFKNRYHALSYYNAKSGVSMIFLDYEDIGAEIFEIYHPKKTVFWDISFEIRYFVIVSFRQDELERVKLYNEILQTILIHRHVCRRLIQDPHATLENLYHQVIEQNALSK